MVDRAEQEQPVQRVVGEQAVGDRVVDDVLPQTFVAVAMSCHLLALIVVEPRHLAHRDEGERAGVPEQRLEVGHDQYAQPLEWVRDADEPVAHVCVGQHRTFRNGRHQEIALCRVAVEQAAGRHAAAVGDAPDGRSGVPGRGELLSSREQHAVLRRLHGHLSPSP